MSLSRDNGSHRGTASAVEHQLSRPMERQQPSHLAAMPHEILVMILNNILIGHSPTELHSKRRLDTTAPLKKQKTTDTKPWTAVINVLLSCRALYYAGLEVFYENTALKFHQGLHLHKFVSGLSDDQKSAVRTIEMHLQWTRSRRSANWALLHESDMCSNWKEEVDLLPHLKCLVLKCYSQLDESEMMGTVDVSAFERTATDELGPRYAGMVLFVWPDTGDQ